MCPAAPWPVHQTGMIYAAADERMSPWLVWRSGGGLPHEGGGGDGVDGTGRGAGRRIGFRRAPRWPWVGGPGGVGRFRRCFGSGTEWVTHRMPRRLPRALASARAAPVLSATSGFSYSEAAKDAGDHPAHWVAKSTPSGMRSHQPCRPHRHPVRRHPRFRRCPPEFRRLVTDFADGTLCSRYRLQPRRVARQRRPRRVSLVGQDVPAARRPAKMGRAV